MKRSILFLLIFSFGIFANLALMARDRITSEDVEYVRQQADKLLKGSIMKSVDGTDLYTPDGQAHYAALWTRDFAYMVQNAGELIPAEDIKACIEHTISGIRVDGAVPDRVQTDNLAVYAGGSPEKPLGEPNLDNAPFLILTIYDYLTKYSGLNQSQQIDQFKKWESVLMKAVNYVPLSSDGLIYNDPSKPHSPYGFTDTVKKGGKLFKESLLYWESLKKLAILYEMAGMKQEQTECENRAKAVENSISTLWSSQNGMFLAATQNCRQVDIWGNIYALYIGFPLEKEKQKSIENNLVKNYDRYVKWGQVRHLYDGEYWEDLLMPVEHNRYQNGAYWATPAGWLITVLSKISPDLAQRTACDVIDSFRANGIYECIYDDYKQLDSYVVSVTNILPAVKLLYELQ